MSSAAGAQVLAGSLRLLPAVNKVAGAIIQPHAVAWLGAAISGVDIHVAVDITERDTPTVRATQALPAIDKQTRICVVLTIRSSNQGQQHYNY